MNLKHLPYERRCLAIVKTASLLVLALILCARAVAADSITISETYTERLASDQSLHATHTGSFKIAITHPELGCAPLSGGMPFEISVGGFSFDSLLGAADAISSSQFTFYVRDDYGRRVGTITLGRNFSQLLITGTFSRLPASIVARDFLGEVGPLSGSTDARIGFGSFVVNRPVYFSGRQSVSHREIDGEIAELYSIAVTGKADYARPGLTISSPRPGQRFEANTITLTGAVKDNVAPISVQVQVNGTELYPLAPSETGDWQSDVGLTPGTNVIAVWARDLDGNISVTNTLRIFHVVTEPLKLTWDGEGAVTGLTNGQRLEIGRGYKLTARPAATTRFGGWNGGGEHGPIQSPESALNFIMQPGIALHASFIPPVLAPLTLEVTPGNGVTGVSNGAPLEIGKVYQATARPGPENLFLGWTGSVQSSNAALKFVMQSNMVLQANFALNPWLPIAGNYAGLIYFESQAPLDSGSFALTLTANGRITGKLRMRGESLPFSTKAGRDGRATARVPRPKCMESLSLELGFDVAGKSGGIMIGNVGSPTIFSYLAGNRAAGDATYAGRYTFRIRSAQEVLGGDEFPDGEGAGTILVDTRGKATVAATLGDGTPVTFSTVVFRDGYSPFETPIYGGRGLLHGWVDFATNVPPLHVQGYDMIWFKPWSASDRYYPGGFVTQRSLMATRYTPPPSGSNALSWSEGVVGFDGGELPDLLGVGIHVTNNIVRPTDGFPKVTVTLAPKTGLLTVAMVHPFTLKTFSGKGVVLQFDPPYEGFGYPVSGMGAGWFRGRAQTGFVRLLPLPPAEAR